MQTSDLWRAPPSRPFGYAWVAYWLGFAGFTLNAARYPGLVANPTGVPYPWAAALLTCALLGEFIRGGTRALAGRMSIIGGYGWLERLLREAGFGTVVRRDEYFFQPLLVAINPPDR